MKTKLITLILASFFMGVSSLYAENEEREVSAFSEIFLKVPAKLYLEQGKKQSIEIVAKSSTLEEIITEVNKRKLVIRFPNKAYLWKDFNPGKIEIFITVPEIEAINLSGSGDVIAEGEIEARILDMMISGSGDIEIQELKSERVKAIISGSGDLKINDGGPVTDLSLNVTGSGDVKALGLDAEDVNIKLAGSGNCEVNAQKHLTIKLLGSGGIKYSGDPLIDQTVLGSGSVKKID